MGIRVGVWAILAGAMAGCRAPAPAVVRAPLPPRVPVVADMPVVAPVPANPDLRSLPKSTAAALPTTFRGLTESACAGLAAANASTANMLEDENRVAGNGASERLRREVRYFASLELRNKAAAEALERFFQLADAEARLALVRESLPILDELLDRAKRAKEQGVRFPFDAADLERQRSQVMSQLEQAEGGVRLLNIDLRHRLQLPTPSPGESLWPTGDFGIDGTPADAEATATAALTGRAELRGLRALHAGLNADTLDDVRDQLHAANPLLGGRSTGVKPASGGISGHIARAVMKKMMPDPAVVAAEVEIRKRQLGEWIVTRERVVADETRAAATALNDQTTRLTLARDRADSWKAKWDDAVKQRDAKLPGAEYAEFSVRLEWLKAKSEVIAEAMTWHQARVRLLAARGVLAPESATPSVMPMTAPPPVVPWVSAVR